MKASRGKTVQRYSPYDAAAVGNPYMVKSRSNPAAEWLGQQMATGTYYEMQPALYQYPTQAGMQGLYPGYAQFLTPASAPNATNEIPVSQTSEAKSVAGKIAADARKAELAPLVARGKVAINTATKAIAMADSFLVKDNISICCSPYHKKDLDASHEGRSVVFFLKKRPITTSSPTPTTVIKITKTGNPSKMAGCIAAKIRQKEVIAMQGIGPDAVQLGVDAFVAARRFLKVDSPLDITFRPKFVTVAPGDKTLSSMYFEIEARPRD